MKNFCGEIWDEYGWELWYFMIDVYDVDDEDLFVELLKVVCFI